MAPIRNVFLPPVPPSNDTVPLVMFTPPGMFTMFVAVNGCDSYLPGRH